MGKRLTTNATTYKIYEASIMARKYVVKRLFKDLSDGTKGVYYYVYEQYRQGNKVVTKYIGKLDDIIEFFIKHRNSGKWWTGRDLNPGPLGCQPSALPG